MIPGISYSNKTILLCPLDWGLGHAARCVPLIKQLQVQGNRVIIGCTGWQKEFLQGEISELEYTPLFGYDVKYSEKIAFGLKILSQIPRLLMLVKKEHAWLKGFLKKNKVDVVVSDNRFGLYNEDVECVFMTHQLFVSSPFLESTVNKLNLSYVKKYNTCWVPDHEDVGKSLSGVLSHNENMPANVRYIGPLSRFTSDSKMFEKKFDVLVLLSGVEPQRSVLEKKLINALEGTGRIAIVRGVKDDGKRFPSDFYVMNRVNTSALEELLLSSEKIICRSGYSTLMDLEALGLKALLVPTPGQTEQEYLAKYWKEKFGFEALSQAEISRERLAGLLNLQGTPQLQKRSV